MEILSVLREGPRGPTRLAQAVGLSFDAFVEYARLVEAKKLVTKSVADGHEFYSISPDGNQVLLDWEKIWDKISPDSE